LLVSHDRAMLDAVASRILAVEDASLRSTDGGWAEYVRRWEKEQAAAATPASKHPRRKAKQPAPVRQRASELERAEEAVYAHEQEVAELERRLAEEWTDAEAVAAHARARN
jgi:ATP-binding cassette, subfamily F, member 3